MHCTIDAVPEMLNQEACRRWWLRRLHPAGPSCPHCGVTVVGPRAETWRNDGQIRCSSCRHYFTNRTSTPMQGSTANWAQLYLVALFTAYRLPLAVIVAICGLSENTVRAWQRRFREAS